MQSTKNNKRKKLLIVLSYFVVFGFGIIAGTGNQNSVSSTTSSSDVAPAAEVKQEPINVALSGSSNTATEPFKLRAGLATFKMHYGGNSNFIVRLLDTKGNDIEGLVNEIGSFDGSKAVQIPREGEYVLNLEHAMGDWTVNITQ